MSDIATEAAVGVGTLYRHFPTRESLLNALTHRSFEAVLRRAQTAAADASPAIRSLANFFDDTIRHRDELFLPFHGRPVVLDRETEATRKQIREALEAVLARGRADGTVRADVTATDIIITGAMLAQPLPHVPDWDRQARRQAELYVAGLQDGPTPSGPRHRNGKPAT